MSGDHAARRPLVRLIVRLLWLTRYGPEGPSARYRVWQFLEPLERHGVRSVALPLASWRAGPGQAAWSVGRRLAGLLRRASADVVIVQKAPVMPARLWPLAKRLLGRQRSPIIWDLDDAIWANSDNERRLAEGMCRLAAVVVAGNELIAAWARTAGARRVEVIPTCYSPRNEVVRDTSSEGGPEVVWIGSPSTAMLLAQEERRIRQVLSAPGARLTMIGGEPPASMSDLRIEVVPWSIEAEHAHLSASDFGLALQPRNEFADHKCGFKIVQYMAYGVVPIATDNPVHRQIMGELGLLLAADTDAHQVEAFVRAGVGESDREAVRRRWQSRFATDVGVEAWAELLRGMVS